MTIKKYIYYNTATGEIENIISIAADVVDTLEWPAGYAVAILPDGLTGTWSTCGTGWSYINGEFIEPPMPPLPEQPSVSGGIETL